MDVLIAHFEEFSIVWLGIMASLVAGVATGIGAIPVLFTQNVSVRAQDTMLGFGAGVMLAATSFSLIVPGIEAATRSTGSSNLAALIAMLGILLGGIFLYLADRYLPHEHFIKGKEGADLAQLRRIWLFIIAITLHNFPEGIAVGVGFGAGDVRNGLILAIGIGLQNIPGRISSSPRPAVSPLYKVVCLRFSPAYRFS